MSPFTLEHFMIARYVLLSPSSIASSKSLQQPNCGHFIFTTITRITQPSCNSDTAVRVRLANQSAVLVTRGGSESTLRSGAVTLWHITWAAALAVALGTAEVSGQSLHTDGFLIGFAASLWVAVVGGVGCHGHLQHATSMERQYLKKLNIREVLFYVKIFNYSESMAQTRKSDQKRTANQNGFGDRMYQPARNP